MTQRATTRGVAATAATTLAVGALAFLGAGVAGAAPGSITWDDGSSRFTRTVSNTAPAVGDTVTVTTNFDRTSWVDEFIYNVKDRHPSCLTYVPGSAKMIGQSEYPVSNPEVVADEGNGTGYVRASWGVTDWVVQNRPGFHRSPTFSVSYKVGQNCPRGTALATGMDYGGSLGSGGYGTKGPSITMAKTGTTTTLADVTGARVGVPSTLTATVTGGAPGDTVEFLDAATPIGQATLDAGGTATLPWTPSIRGSHALSAQFAGTAFATTSQSAVITVQVAEQNGTSTIALAPVTDAQVGRASTVTATVSPAAAGGTVELRDGAVSLATLPVGNDGKVTYQWVPAAAGAHTLTATFSGRDGVIGSTTTGQVTVAEAPASNTDSTTTLSPVGGATVGQATTLTAKVTPADAGGTVTFKDGNTVVGTAQVGADGTATTEWTPATAGQITVTAEYSGNGTVNASSDRESVIVAPADGDGGTGGNGSLDGFGSSS
ncbi:Ig-like domain-containing protein [Rhodococcus tukisamuensis]|uniref:Ig-like domain (Group 3) n=1 Tax=Rhodococcus tukisamuensis TaxID=168276 RepID=A0A1G6W7Z1_9NOCA|nr:Ig-like domain-containing protein [Rhodococcus tukisamuensis]SDD61347.1 Ig-like domain (group 3) [Rhodococcus tukisamuensis]